MDLGLHWQTVVPRLLLAVLCGALIGWEREAQNKSAGLRTHVLASLGAAGFTLTGLMAFRDFGGGDSELDPLRIVQGVATGIGFLGAGSILKKGSEAHGLTTAAGIWTAGAAGAACGLGYYALGGLVAVLAVITLAANRLSDEPL